MAELRDSRIKVLAKEGTLIAQYTQNGYFVKIKPSVAIDKVCFSFVKKGTSGSGFDVYMDIDRFSIWCRRILDGRFYQTIAAERKAGEKYPKDYKWVTGEKGEKSIGFCASQNGDSLVIDGKSIVNGENVFANVPVDTIWLENMAVEFSYIEDIWRKELAKLVLQGASAFNRDLANNGEAIASNENPPMEENVPLGATNSPASAQNVYKDMMIKTIGKLEPIKNLFRVAIEDTFTRETGMLYFNEESISTLGSRWETLKNNLSSTIGLTYNVSVDAKGKDYLLKTLYED